MKTLDQLTPDDAPLSGGKAWNCARLKQAGLYESDWALPRYSEDPTPLFRTVRAHLDDAPDAQGWNGIPRQTPDAAQAWSDFERQLTRWQRWTLLPRARRWVNRIKQYYVGGVLSHAPTVAREYGLPALANVRNATKRLGSGERVVLNATGGFVRKLSLLLILLTTIGVGAEDWPEFRGPTGQGHSTERGLPLEWSESRNVVWKTPVPGSGWSSPVVAGGRVWLTSAVEAGGISLRALAFDIQTGREVVNVEVFRLQHSPLLNPKNSRASPTPIVEGDHVYVHFGTDGTAALTTSGDVVWTARFPYESQHGNGGSPTLHGDLLIFSCDGSDDAFVVAVDKRTGKVRWKTGRRQPFDQAYSTPLVIKVGDRDQVVSVGAYRAGAYDPQSGREIWRVSYSDGFSNVPRPVFGHGLVYIATGFQEPSLIAVRADGTGDVTGTHVAWTLRRSAPLTPSPLLVGDQLYIVNDVGIASCLDAKTGEAHWRQRLNGNYSASPVFAEGRIYFLSEEGVATVIAPGTAFSVLATNTLDGAALASMAVSAGSIFIRSDRHLYRLGSVR